MPKTAIDDRTTDAQRAEMSLLAVLQRLWRFMGRHRPLYMVGLALGIIDSACQTLIPMVFRSVLNGIQAGDEAFGHSGLLLPLVGAVGIAVLFFPAAYFFHLCSALAVVRLTRDMRSRLYFHVQRLSADFFQRRHVGEINQRLNNDIDTLNQAGHQMMSFTWASFMVIWSLAGMLYIDIGLTGIFLLLMAGVTIWTRAYLPRIRRMSRAVRDSLGDTSAAITEYVGLNELIRSYAREDAADAHVDRQTDKVRRKQEHLARWRFLFGDLTQMLLRFVAPFVLLFAGAWMISHGKLKTGDLVAFYAYWLMIGNSINSIINTFQQLFAGLASADRVFEIFDERPLVQDAPDARELTGVRGEIAFEHVSFNYPTETRNPVLRDVSFTIEPGQRLAIVGPSGAGKSTILQLVLRFYDPAAGRVLIDGQDLREMAQRSLRAHIGMVMQESVFFSGTVAENLRLGRADATEQQMRDALAAADLLAFIDEQPDGIHTTLGERGARLSGGQKQRLSIARVFLKNPPILLFDEATSSLDSLAEKQVQAAMERLMAGRTTLIVAHRISTVQNADRILVLRDGKVQATGTHAELAANDPLYRQLCLHQQLVV